MKKKIINISNLLVAFYCGRDKCLSILDSDQKGKIIYFIIQSQIALKVIKYLINNCVPYDIKDSSKLNDASIRQNIVYTIS